MTQTTQTRQAQCQVPLPDGRRLTVTAVANPAAGAHSDLALVKLGGGASQTLQQRLRNAVLGARLTEFQPGDNWRVDFYLDPLPDDRDRAWELAAVVADRQARGVLPSPPGACLALGCSDQWETGQVSALPEGDAAIRLEQLDTLQEGDLLIVARAGDSSSAIEQSALATHCRAEVQFITHLGDLLGHPDPSAAVRQARVWFPLVGSEARLAWVEVTVSPVAADRQGAGIQLAAGGNRTLAREVPEVLEQARSRDPVHIGRWQTRVRFRRYDFTDDSYQLALVMADRIARGREVPARGRLMATGRSSRWASGEVETVQGRQQKLALLGREAGAGDRILLPAAWRDQIEPDLLEPLRRSDVSVAFVQQIPAA